MWSGQVAPRHLGHAGQGPGRYCRRFRRAWFRGTGFRSDGCCCAWQWCARCCRPACKADSFEVAEHPARAGVAPDPDHAGIGRFGVHCSVEREPVRQVDVNQVPCVETAPVLALISGAPVATGCLAPGGSARFGGGTPPPSRSLPRVRIGTGPGRILAVFVASSCSAGHFFECRRRRRPRVCVHWFPPVDACATTQPPGWGHHNTAAMRRRARQNMSPCCPK